MFSTCQDGLFFIGFFSFDLVSTYGWFVLYLMPRFEVLYFLYYFKIFFFLKLEHGASFPIRLLTLTISQTSLARFPFVDFRHLLSREDDAVVRTKTKNAPKVFIVS